MATKDGFPNALNEALQKLPPGDETKDAAGRLLNKHRDDMREIATMPNNEKARRQHLGKLDNWLLDELAQLSDTEQPDQGEGEPPPPDQPPPPPAPVEQPTPAPEASSGGSRRRPR